MDEEEEMSTKQVAEISLNSDDESGGEKENKPAKAEKRGFGSAKVIEGKKNMKKVEKKRTFLDDEGNMVTEKYFVEVEVEEGDQPKPSTPKAHGQKCGLRVQ